MQVKYERILHMVIKGSLEVISFGSFPESYTNEGMS